MMSIFSSSNLDYLGSYENDYPVHIVLNEKQVVMIFLDLLRSYEEENVLEKDEWEEEDLREHLVSYVRSGIEDFLLRHRADGILVIAERGNHHTIEDGDEFLDFLAQVFRNEDYLNEIVRLWLRGKTVTTQQGTSD